MSPVDTAQLLRVGLDAGLVAVGVTSAEAFDDARAVIEARKREGLHGDMDFTYRNPRRSSDPRQTLPSARSLVVGALDYHRDPPPPALDAGPLGRVAAYAREDHYATLRAALQKIADALGVAGYRALVLADQNNLIDRAAAHRAGLGWWGKSSNILVPEVGSMVVIGSVLTDAPLETERQPVEDGCGSCRECLDGCPTGAIIDFGVVDARRCLAWLVQADGMFPPEYRIALGDRIYGCDDCQDVCPPNRVRIRRPASAAAGEAWVPVLEMLGASDDDLIERYGRWYIPNREPRYLRRNALLVLGNTGDPEAPDVVATVETYLADPDPLLRAHAVWTAKRLGLESSVPVNDPDPRVEAELRRTVQHR
jgi:epoxyqueuosine reductase